MPYFNLPLLRMLVVDRLLHVCVCVCVKIIERLLHTRILSRKRKHGTWPGPVASCKPFCRNCGP